MKTPFPIPRKIIFSVVGAHLAFCCFFFFSKAQEKERRISGNIQAKHFTLERDLPRTLSAASEKKVKPIQSRSKTQKEAPKKQESSSKKTTQLAKKDHSLKADLPREKQTPSASKETQKDNASQKTECSPLIDKKSASKPSNAPTTTPIVTYLDHVGYLLEKKVLLKESGQVTVKLKLDHKGELLKLEIVSASDADLIGPVKEQIKALDFPPFDATMKNIKSEVFTFELSAD